MVETLEQMLDLSEEILEAARHQKWETVEKLEEQRARLMDSLNQQPAPADRTSSLKAETLIASIKAVDKQTLPLLEAQQDATLKARQKSSKGKQMSQAYRSLNR